MATSNHYTELKSKWRDQNLSEEEMEALENLYYLFKTAVLGGDNIKTVGVEIGEGSLNVLATFNTGDRIIPQIIDCYPNGADIYLGSAYLRKNIMGAIWRNIPYQSMPAMSDCCKISQEYFESQIMPKKTHSGEVVIKRSVFTPAEFIQSIFGTKYGSERSKIEEKVLEALYKGNEIGNKLTGSFEQLSKELYNAVEFDMAAQLSDKFNSFTEINKEDFKDFANSVNNGLIAIENVEVKTCSNVEAVAYSKMMDRVSDVATAVIEDVKETEFMQTYGADNDNTSIADVPTTDATDSGMDAPVNV